MASFRNPEACGQTVLPDRSVLIGQKLVENAKNEKFKCDILSNFQTMCFGCILGILEDHLIPSSPRNIPYNFSVPIRKVKIKGQYNRMSRILRTLSWGTSNCGLLHAESGSGLDL